METIKQKDYPQLEIDCREQDIIQVWMNGKDDSNVIQIEKSNLQALIDLLKREDDSFKNLNKAPVMRSCPFCGADELHIQEEPSRDGTIIWYKILHNATTDCGVLMLGSNKEALISRWNRRA